MVDATPSRVRTISIINMIGAILLVVILLLAGGVYGYKKYTEGKLTKLQDKIGEFEESLELTDIEAMIRADRAITRGGDLLDSHVTSSTVFNLLEDNTLLGVSYTSFSYDATERMISLNAKIVNDEIFAEQLKTFRLSNAFSSVGFENINLLEDDSVEVLLMLGVSEAAL